MDLQGRMRIQSSPRGEVDIKPHAGQTIGTFRSGHVILGEKGGGSKSFAVCMDVQSTIYQE